MVCTRGGGICGERGRRGRRGGEAQQHLHFFFNQLVLSFCINTPLIHPRSTPSMKFPMLNLAILGALSSLAGDDRGIASAFVSTAPSSASIASPSTSSGMPLRAAARGRGTGYGPPLENIGEAVGNTPLVRVSERICPPGRTIYAKCESFNPLSSVKDRLALAIIEAAERDGTLKPGQTVVEATSGNTGIGEWGTRCVVKTAWWMVGAKFPSRILCYPSPHLIRRLPLPPTTDDSDDV